MCMRVLRIKDNAYPSGKIFAQVLVVGTGYQQGEDAPSTGRILIFEIADEINEAQGEGEGEGEGEGGAAHAAANGSAAAATAGGGGDGGGPRRKLRLISAVEERGPVLALATLQGSHA